MIKSLKRSFRGLPEPVLRQIRQLKVARDSDSAGAVIAQGIARLLGGYACLSCGAYIGKEVPPRPPPADSTRWPEITEKHVEGCKWIRTKGFQIPG